MMDPVTHRRLLRQHRDARRWGWGVQLPPLLEALSREADPERRSQLIEDARRRLHQEHKRRS